MKTQEEINKFIDSQPYYGTCTTEYKEGIQEGIDWVQSQDNWIVIKSKEDLPKVRTHCWFFDKNIGIIAGEFLNNSKEEVDFILANATHYLIMNKPNPPKSI
jgi:hypothetical protein